MIEFFMSKFAAIIEQRQKERSCRFRNEFFFVIGSIARFFAIFNDRTYASIAIIVVI